MSKVLCLHRVDREEGIAALCALAEAGEANGVKGTPAAQNQGPHFLLARLYTAEGREFSALLQPSLSSIRLIVGGSFLGRKVRVVVLRRDGSELDAGTFRQRY